MSLIHNFVFAYLRLLPTVNDSTAAMADESWQLLCINFVFTLPSEWIVVIGRVDDVKLDRAANSDACANKLYGASTWIKCRGSSRTRKVRITTSTADVIRVFQLEVTVRQQTTGSHANSWTLTSWLQVWNTDKSKQTAKLLILISCV